MMFRLNANSLTLTALAVLGAGCADGGHPAIPLTASGQSATVGSHAERVRIHEFADLPHQYSANYIPSSIVAGRSDDLWVTDVSDPDYGLNVVVHISRSGKRLQSYHYTGSLSPGSELDDITVGPDGALWMPDVLNQQIVRMTTRGTFTQYGLPSSTIPFNIVTGSDDALWVTANTIHAGAIVRITTAGRIKLYPTKNENDGITAGPDGALWFTEYQAASIGRITTHGKLTEYSQGISAGPGSIAPGPDGALWFTEPVGGRIGRITTAGQVTEYSYGITAKEEPHGIAAGPDGAMWFTEYANYGSYEPRLSKIGRITMNGEISEYFNGLDPAAGPTAIIAGPGGNMWFVTLTDKTGRVSL